MTHLFRLAYSLILCWAVVLSSLLSSFFCGSVAWAEEAVYVYGDRSSRENESSVFSSDVLVEDYFSKKSEFNYFEGESLNATQTLSLNGLDQRFLDLSYNGFSLRDPSHPTGVFNVFNLLGMAGKKRLLRAGNRLQFKSDTAEGGFVEFSFSQLGEFETVVDQSVCDTDFCYSAGASLKRGGGFSQKFEGEENDYFHRMHLNFDAVSFKEGYEDKTFLFYSGQIFDEDSVGIFSNLEPESLVAKSKSATLFFGKRYEFKKWSIGGSYLQSHRSQANSDFDLKFSQRSEVQELQFKMQQTELNAFREAYDLFDDRQEDYGLVLKQVYKNKKNIFRGELNYTEQRELFGAFNYDRKGFGVFFKALPPSLFQSSYNLSQGAREVRNQQLVGAEWNKDFNLSPQLLFDFKLAYSRAFDFIDFNLTENRYDNLSRVENALAKTQLKWSGPGVETAFFVQNQRAKNLSTGQDLVNRPDWTIGLGLLKKVDRFKIEMDLRWISSRRAFDGSELSSFWQSLVRLERGGFALELRNVLDQQDEVFRGLGRRPLTLELKYRKTF